MKCKDINELYILEFLNNLYPHVACSFGKEFTNSIHNAFTIEIPNKLLLAKMKKLIRQNLVDGCACGCRGDFEITALGKGQLIKLKTLASESTHETQNS